MVPSTDYGTFGFRYSEDTALALCHLFAVGYERVHRSAYEWDGLTRTDGPLLLFQYTISGEGWLELDKRKERMLPGKAFLVEIPGEHRYWYEESDTPWEFYYILIRPTLISPNWQDVKKRIGTTPMLPTASSPIRLLRQIFTEAQAGRITDSFIASSFVYQIIAELGHFASADKRDRDGWPEKIHVAARYMEANYANMVSLDELAEHLHISKYHFLRTFGKTVGITPHAYLNRIRIERAMELLHNSEHSIEEIAQLVGYSSGSYFIKVFTKLTGLTPGAFRSGQDSLLYSRLFLD